MHLVSAVLVQVEDKSWVKARLVGTQHQLAYLQILSLV